MKITDVKVWLKDNEDGKKIKATASMTFDNCFVVDGLRIVEGTKGLFVAMPSKRVATGSEDDYRDIAHPLNAECREMVHNTVMQAYKDEVAKVEAEKAATEAK